MPGAVIVSRVNYLPADGLGGMFQVATRPAMMQFSRRFWRGNSGDPHAEAIEFAAMSAAALGWVMIDETGRLAPALCAALVAEQAGKGGASVVPITAAMDRRAARAAG